MDFYVNYNGKNIAVRKSVTAALKFIQKKKLKDDADNLLFITDEKGETYNPVKGDME